MLGKIGEAAWRGARAAARRLLPKPAVEAIRAWRVARYQAAKERRKARQREAKRAAKERRKARQREAKKALKARQGGKTGRTSRHTEQERIYWNVNSIFQSVLGEGRVMVRMTPEDAWKLEVEDSHSDFRACLTVDPDRHRITVVQEAAGRTFTLGEFERPQAAGFATLRALLERPDSADDDDGRSPRTIWVPVVDGKLVPRMLRLQPQWTTALHRSGWGWALETLASLDDERGVIFDGFLEATFCWKDTGQVYRKPWVGVCHNPPRTPEWLTTNEKLFASERMRRSLTHCKGLFVLSSHHREELRKRVDVPISVILHPSETPELRFSIQAFERNPHPRLIQIGHWLRNPNSLYQLRVERLVKTRLDLGHPWEEGIRAHLPPVDGLDMDSVEVVPRVSDAEYDSLLSRNIVFLHLIDSSANNAVIECIVRNTPILVNRLPAVVEYLGREYPFYFEDLEEAARKAENGELIRRTHQYLRSLPKERFTREGFLHAFVQSTVYRSLLPTGVQKLLLLTPGASCGPLLRTFEAHPDVRMLEQPFHPGRGAWSDDSHHPYRQDVRDQESLARCLDQIHHYYTGIEHGLGQLPEHLERRLLSAPSQRLLVWRRNRLKAAVLALLEEHTPLPPSEPGVATAGPLTLEPEAVADRMHTEEVRLEQTCGFLRERGLKVFEVALEDICGPDVAWAQQEELIRALYSLIGADAPDARLLERVAGLLREEGVEESRRLARLSNAEEIERRLGSEEAGSLATGGRGATGSTSPRWAGRGSTLPFPDAGSRVLLFHGTHHKAGTHWLLRILRSLSKLYEMQLSEGNDRLMASSSDILVDQHSRTDLSKLPPFRGSHMVRDPRDMVISGYFYHLWTQETWVHDPDPRYGGRSYQQYLNAVDREEGLLEEINRCAFTFEAMAGWNYQNPLIFEIRYEDLMREGVPLFRRLFEHYGFAPEAVEVGLEIAEKNSFQARTKRSLGQVEERSVLRSGRAGQWREHFTPSVKRHFQETTGELLQLLGYEEDDRW